MRRLESTTCGATPPRYTTSMIRVPLIIKFGRGSADVPTPGSRWERPFQLVDIMPTILAAAGVAIPPGLDGRPAAEVSTPLRSWAFPPRQKMRSSGDRFAELRSIEIDGWKLIEHHTGEVELYELSTDPGEVVNRAGTQPERVALMLGNLGLWASYRSENRPRRATDVGRSTRTTALPGLHPLSAAPCADSRS